jgi:hypothetical protein
MGRRPKLPYEVAVRPDARPSTIAVVVRLSDYAYNALWQEAVTYGYVKGASSRARGLVGYLYNLANPAQEWMDVRPQHLVDLSTRLLDPAYDLDRRRGAERTPTFLFDPDLQRAHPYPPRNTTSGRMAHRARASAERTPGARHAIWWDPDVTGPRKPRRLAGGDEGLPVQYYASLAMRFGIAAPHARDLKPNHPMILASDALEAIGQGHLKPSVSFHNPNPPPYTTVRVHSNKEIDW